MHAGPTSSWFARTQWVSVGPTPSPRPRQPFSVVDGEDVGDTPPIAFATTAGITRRSFIPSIFGSTTIFITPAFAQTAGAAAGPYDSVIQMLTLIGPIVIIMYFMVFRPQQKRAREQADLIKNIRRGDTVITTGGLIGKVTKAVDDAEIEIEIAPNVRVRVSRPMVTIVRAKGEPVKDVAAS